MSFADVELPMGAVPELGEHTERVLSELGVDTATFERLVGEGTVARPSTLTGEMQHGI